MSEQQAAITQVRETLIKSGIQFAVRLRELRSTGENYDVAVSKSGALAIIATTGNPSIYRFGSLAATTVARASGRTVARWNQEHPNHPVELVSIQRALETECSRVFLLLHEIEENIRRQELKS
jgi:hypothetical protein